MTQSRQVRGQSIAALAKWSWCFSFWHRRD